VGGARLDQGAAHLGFGAAGGNELGGALGAAGDQAQLRDRLRGLRHFAAGLGHQGGGLIHAERLGRGVGHGGGSSQ
jgi:hypothetical protein